MSLLLVGLRTLLTLIAIASLLPMVRIGWWPIRLCDFLRAQIAVIAVVLVGCEFVGLTIGSSGIDWPYAILLNLSIAIGQGMYLLPYTAIWKRETQNASSNEEEQLSVAVVNLKYDNNQRATVLEQLQAHSVDLLLLIEIDRQWSDSLSGLQSDYPHRVGEIRENGLGLMLWSRLPLEEAQVMHLVTEDRPSIRARVVLENGNAVEFIGIHPLPPGLPKMQDSGRHDSRIRDAELMLVAERIASKPHQHWLVTGDFNDVAWSYTTRLFRRISGLQDPRIGRGFYNSYHAGYAFLRFPIDHVFVSPRTRIHQLNRFRLAGSDHFAITAYLSWQGFALLETQSTCSDSRRAHALIREGRADAAQQNDPSV